MSNEGISGSPNASQKRTNTPPATTPAKIPATGPAALFGFCGDT